MNTASSLAKAELDNRQAEKYNGNTSTEKRPRSAIDLERWNRIRPGVEHRFIVPIAGTAGQSVRFASQKKGPLERYSFGDRGHRIVVSSQKCIGLIVYRCFVEVCGSLNLSVRFRQHHCGRPEHHSKRFRFTRSGSTSTFQRIWKL